MTWFLLTPVLTASKQHAELFVYRIQPQQVRYMREWALEYFEVPIE